MTAFLESQMIHRIQQVSGRTLRAFTTKFPTVPPRIYVQPLGAAAELVQPIHGPSRDRPGPAAARRQMNFWQCWISQTADGA
jgi:hypothetical protein